MRNGKNGLRYIYRRVSINVKTAGQVMFLGHAPDLDSRWQIVIVTANMLFSLQDMLAMKLGIQFMRREDALANAREQDGINYLLTVNSKLLASWKLTAAQKVLLTHYDREPLFSSDFDKICRAAYFRSKWNSTFFFFFLA